jgi:RNA polymerase sigma-70 factor (ECF subfamily)
MCDEVRNWCERLYQRKAAGLILYGRALGLSHCEAEDVLQEIFVALLRRERPPDEPEHYCLRAVRNRAINYRRGLWRRLRRELESHHWFERPTGATETESAAIRCLETLPVAQREVIVLKIWHEFTFEKIGQMLDISPNTAAGRYRYGLQKLRAAMQGENYERTQSGEAAPFLDPASSFG